jgi:hypothetical protein
VPIRWPAGLLARRRVAVLPHYDAWPEPFSALIAPQAPAARSCLDRRGHGGRGRDGAWQVHGAGA